MLEKPNIRESELILILQKEYRLQIVEIAFLPMGADVNAAVYQLISTDGTSFFLKLRKGPFEAVSVQLPRHYHDLGISQIIACIPTVEGKLSGCFNQYKTLLYPFVVGKNGYEQQLSKQNWAEFGQALKQLHTAEIPSNIIKQIRHETFSAEYRDGVRQFLNQINSKNYADAVAIELTLFLKQKQAEILDLINWADTLADQLKGESLEQIVCHSDLHAGNLLIGGNHELFIVDWDEPILAPKERDLMFVGGALLASGLSPEEEEHLFYESYGPEPLNQPALTYYRCERIIQDIFEYCKELLLSDEGGADRQQSLAYLKSNFEPNHTIEAAYRS